ncbi:MAG: NERD domain-containing protein [Curvibacter sp.]|nr:NERD domain-containing protein [Curvibacter sp.]
MLLKKADDKSKRIALLNDLQQSPVLNASQRKWLRDELMRCRKGIQGETEAAFYLDSSLKNAQNHVLLHDLRLIDDGVVAQIDHLLIGRGNLFYLIETKNFAGNLIINDEGEFTVDYGDMKFGIPSPMEQSRRHERVLRKVLERLGINGRLGGEADFIHVVMLHPKGIITRPSADRFDTSSVIKADQFDTWRAKFVEKELGVGRFIKAVANLRSIETIQEWGKKLMMEHRPADLLALPEFMKPQAGPSVAVPSRLPVASPAPAPAPAPIMVSANVSPSSVQAGVSPPSDGPAPKRLICSHCGAKISYPEGKFCWNNPTRFGGLQYCREHQVLF